MFRKYLPLLLAVCSAAVGQTRDGAASFLWEEAVLYRDEWGVPHVYAENPRAMAFAFGYAQAEDHLERMLLAYRMANGRAAEVLGEPLAASDEFALKLGHADLAYEAYEQADAITADLCEGFALGVNTWLMEHGDAAPDWAEGVHPADVLALMHVYLVSLAPFDFPESYHLEPGTPSANAWAVAPSKSKDGRAMLVVNPHVDYAGPFQWYEAHLVTPGLDMYGATLFGLPVIVQGHNGALGWALSPSKADVGDLYVEIPVSAPKRNPKSVMPARNRTPFFGLPLVKIASARYYVATESGFSEREVSQLGTPRGPVVAETQGRLLTWRVGGYRDFGAIRQLFDMGRSRDLVGFREAVSRLQLSPFHVVYADRDGNIWYGYSAMTGDRPPAKLAERPGMSRAVGGTARSVYEGPVSTKEGYFEWGPALQPEQLPALLNPEAGFIQASGTPPWLTTVNSGLDPGAWPDWLVRDVDSYRAKRARRLFSLGSRSFRDVQAMLFDTVAPLAAGLSPYLVRLAEEHPEWLAEAHPDLLVAVDMLRDWDYLADPDSMAMTFFHVWWSILRVGPDGTPWPSEVVHGLVQEDAPWFREHAFLAAAEAAKLLRNEYQTMNVPWGEVHRLRRGRRDEPIGGARSGEPLFVTGDRNFQHGSWSVDRGYGFAMAVRFGDRPEAVSLTPFGTSENPASPHYDDQLDLMLERRFKVTHFEREAVERHAASAFGKRIWLRPRQHDAAAFIRSAAPVTARLGVSDGLSATMPPGLAPFTAFIEPVIEPPRTPVTIELELAVPEAVCDASDLDALGVYGYHPVVGWRYVEEQAVDTARRTFMARVYAPEVYAVLGPASRLGRAPGSLAERTQLAGRTQAPEAPGGIRSTRDAGRAPLKPSRETASKGLSGLFSAREITEVARNEDAAVLDIAEADRERVAGLFPPNPTLATGDRREPVTEAFGGGRGWQPVSPAVPPGWAEELQRLRNQPIVPGLDLISRSAPAASRRRVPSVPPIAPDESAAPAPIEASRAEVAIEEIESRPTARDETMPPEIIPAAARPAREPEPDETPSSDGTEHTADDGNKVTWSDKTPRELLGRTRKESDHFLLATDPTRASPMRIGENLELIPPVPGARFHVLVDRSIQAQVFIPERPPAPYPDGLVAFSPVFEIMHNPREVVGTTALFVTVQPGVCDRGRFDALKLYAFDADSGWMAMPGQKSNVEATSFSGLDYTLRSYAVLGPADALIRSPVE